MMISGVSFVVNTSHGFVFCCRYGSRNKYQITTLQIPRVKSTPIVYYVTIVCKYVGITIETALYKSIFFLNPELVNVISDESTCVHRYYWLCYRVSYGSARRSFSCLSRASRDVVSRMERVWCCYTIFYTISNIILNWLL